MTDTIHDQIAPDGAAPDGAAPLPFNPATVPGVQFLGIRTDGRVVMPKGLKQKEILKLLATLNNAIEVYLEELVVG